MNEKARRGWAVCDDSLGPHPEDAMGHLLVCRDQATNEAGRPATITTLCEPLQTTQGSVTQLVNGAVRAGLLRRTMTPRDKRSHQLHLTGKGKRQLADVFTHLGPERKRLADAIDGLL